MSEDKKTGFLVEGSWEKSYLDIAFGSLVQLLGPALEIAGGKGSLTVQMMADFSLTLTVGAFLTSNNLILHTTKQLRSAENETTASKVQLTISDVEATANKSLVDGNKVKGVIDTLQLRAEQALAAVDEAKAELSQLSAVANLNESFLNALGVRGDGTDLTGAVTEALATGQRATGNTSRLTAKDLKMGGAHLGAAGDLAISTLKSNQCAGLTTELTALTTNV